MSLKLTMVPAALIFTLLTVKAEALPQQLNCDGYDSFGDETFLYDISFQGNTAKVHHIFQAGKIVYDDAWTESTVTGDRFEVPSPYQGMGFTSAIAKAASGWTLEVLDKDGHPTTPYDDFICRETR